MIKIDVEKREVLIVGFEGGRSKYRRKEGRKEGKWKKGKKNGRKEGKMEGRKEGSRKEGGEEERYRKINAERQLICYHS